MEISKQTLIESTKTYSSKKAAAKALGIDRKKYAKLLIANGLEFKSKYEKLVDKSKYTKE